jgi:hypothetical protein
MTTAFFPLRTERLDRSQGIFSRQLPRLLAEVLEGGDVALVEWTATKGGEVAHVLVESSLPGDVLREECAARNADAAVIGAVRVRADGVLMSLTRWTNGERTPIVEVSEGSLVDTLHAVATALAAALGISPQLGAIPPNDEAVRAWCFDRDNQVLIDVSGVDALLHREDAFRHAVDVVRAAPSWQPGRDLVQRRREGWAKHGLCALADALSAAVSAALPEALNATQDAILTRQGDDTSLPDTLPHPLSTPSS